MTKRTIMLDASSLIYLVKAGSLDLIGDLYQEVIITGAVYQEAVIEGKRRGHPDAFAIERAVADGRVHVIQSEGLHTAQLDHAAGLYARREVTLERAAEIAGVSIYEMMAYALERDLPAQRRSGDIRADAAAMLVRNGRPDIAARLVG